MLFMERGYNHRHEDFYIVAGLPNQATTAGTVAKQQITAAAAANNSFLSI